MKISRRPALDSDANWARELHHVAYMDVCVRQFGAWNERVQDAFFESGWIAGGFEVVLFNDHPCGYLRVEILPQNLFLHELVIAPDFQNRGIGSFILRQILTDARLCSIPVLLQACTKITHWLCTVELVFWKQDETTLTFSWCGLRNLR